MSDPTNINDTGLIPRGITALDRAAGEQMQQEPDKPEVLIITGMSGAGRSRAGTTLEDLGWYVVDNLPPRLMRAMIGLMGSGGGVTQLALIVDVRSREYFDELSAALQELSEAQVAYRVLFLDATDAELVKRYENVRRPHPLQGDGRLMDGITRERTLLEQLRQRADVTIDTTTLSVHDLARKIRSFLASSSGVMPVHITVMSFGFKYGIPLDADNVIDMRFLPNPYWVTELRHLTGKDKPVRDFVLSMTGAQHFADQYTALFAGIIDGYQRELKPYVTLAIGCTGGKHRSVAMAEEISRQLRERGFSVHTAHRDLGRE
ncbi:MAG: RNase adapter RapZ [Actinomycetaceae bacterium]|nr:RNase adapter RapZ [Arcanobacterium sp.]MDD7686481.1 RNase adapter RapZ [Actinomycetaceae bacterium]MDY5272761.1 RNase adapter RapZ [Arcanobacterium sp.]